MTPEKIENERWAFSTELLPVTSALIRALRYDDRQHLLEVVFQNGRVYHYVNVPAGVYQNLLNAGSPGRYFATHIRNLYPYWRLHRLPRRKKNA